MAPTRVLIDAHGYPPAEIHTLNLRGLETEIQDRYTEMGRIASLTSPTDGDRDLYDALEARWTALCDARDRLTNQPRPNLRDVVNGGQIRSERGAFDPGRGQPQTSGGGSRDAALRRIDSRRDVADEVRQAMTVSVESARGSERDRLARWIAVSADPTYERALGMALSDPQMGPQMWDEQERAAVRRVTDEARALNLGEPGGGYLVGSTVDFNVMLTSTGSVNPMRRLARQVVTATDTWSGVTSAGIVSSYDAEAAEVSDDSPTFAQPVIPVHKGQSWAQASWEVATDAPGLGAQLATLFADSRDQLEANSLTLGSGIGQPKGLITAIAAVPGSVVISAATSATVADATTLQNTLPPRWRAAAGWMTNLTTMNVYRGLIAGSGLTTPFLDGGQMLGWPVTENSTMDGVVTGSAPDYLLICGDFRQYVVVDRVGMTITPVPVVLGPNRRPTSEVGWLMRWRHGGDVVIPDAFRLLNLSA